MVEEQPQKKPSRWFTCLVKGPLGCLAFLIGGSLVLLLFVPPAAGRVTKRWLETGFTRHFEGSLELGDPWLWSLYNEQRIDSFSLRDPSGDEVLRGSLRAPPIPELSGESKIELHLTSLRLVEFPDGLTNLERTFRRRSEMPLTGLAMELQDTPLQVTLDRLRWSDASGREWRLSDLAWQGQLALRAQRLRFELDGGTDPGLADGLALHAEGEFAPSEEPRFGWRSANLPLGLVRYLTGCVLPLGEESGPNLLGLEWFRAGSQARLALRDESFSLEGEGELDDAHLRLAPGRPGAASFLLGSQLGEVLLARLVPFLVPAVLAGEGEVRVELVEFAFPRDGDWRRAQGELRFRLPSGTFGLDPAALRALGQDLQLAPQDLNVRMLVSDGVTRFVGLRLPLARGMLEYEGGVELATGLADISFTHELDGQRTPLGRWRGRLGALQPAEPLPPIPEPPDAR